MGGEGWSPNLEQTSGPWVKAYRMRSDRDHENLPSLFFFFPRPIHIAALSSCFKKKTPVLHIYERNVVERVFMGAGEEEPANILSFSLS